MAKKAAAGGIAKGQCLCGKVSFEIDVPARWAWHDHSAASRRAHGAAYATYVGSWRKRFRITKGDDAISRYEDKATKTVRSFCATCGIQCRSIYGSSASGVGLYRRAAGAAQGFSGRGVATLEEEAARGG